MGLFDCAGAQCFSVFAAASCSVQQRFLLDAQADRSVWNKLALLDGGESHSKLLRYAHPFSTFYYRLYGKLRCGDFACISAAHFSKDIGSHWASAGRPNYVCAQATWWQTVRREC